MNLYCMRWVKELERRIWQFFILKNKWTSVFHAPILFYIITQVVLAFGLVLAYDLFEDRGTIDVIITQFFLLCFKMAESFENVENILRHGTKDKVQKSLAEALNRFDRQGDER